MCIFFNFFKRIARTFELGFLINISLNHSALAKKDYDSFDIVSPYITAYGIYMRINILD